MCKRARACANISREINGFLTVSGTAVWYDKLVSIRTYTAKSYVLNQKWNQSDPDLYPETQQNFLAMGLIPNCKSDLYQFCSSVSVQQKQP